MKTLFPLFAAIAILFSTGQCCFGQRTLSAEQLDALRKRFPAADTNGDGKLSIQEAKAFRASQASKGGNRKDAWWANIRDRARGVQRDFRVDPGWDEQRFPEQAVGYKSPEEIKTIYEKVKRSDQPAVVSYPKPDDGALRVVGIGHSFMVPGYTTLPRIAQGAGMQQPLYTHIGGGMTGSARYKWEEENGIFGFDGKPRPKLLASISGAEWDVMMFGPYYKDRPVFYACWIDFCLKYNPDMKFYISDAWPQLEQLGSVPKSEDFFTEDVLERMRKASRTAFLTTFRPLHEKYPGKVFVLPTSDAMILAARAFVRGELPGVEGLHRSIGKKQRSLWADQLGHLGPGFERLEGYVFYATLYGKSPEGIQEINFGGDPDFPSHQLDQTFRKIAWQAVIEHPFAGVQQPAPAESHP